MIRYFLVSRHRRNSLALAGFLILVGHTGSLLAFKNGAFSDGIERDEEKRTPVFRPTSRTALLESITSHDLGSIRSAIIEIQSGARKNCTPAFRPALARTPSDGDMVPGAASN
jgi:hypothetical protein